MKYILLVVLTEKANPSNKIFRYFGYNTTNYSEFELFKDNALISHIIGNWRNANEGSEVWVENAKKQLKSELENNKDIVSRWLRRKYNIEFKRLEVGV